MSGDLKWTKCCKGRKCPEVAFEGNNVHIKDDYGNQVVIDKGNIPFCGGPTEFPNESTDPNRTVLRIHGQDSGKPPVRLTLDQFYQLLAKIDSEPEEETPPVVIEEESPLTVEAAIIEEEVVQKQ